MKGSSGLKVLVVEDEASIAILIEDMLEELGCEVAASVSRVDKACRIAREAAFDLAVLDVNLFDRSALPVARILAERQIPLIFSTGYGAAGVPPEFNGCPVLSKPFAREDLEQAISLALAYKS